MLTICIIRAMPNILSVSYTHLRAIAMKIYNRILELRPSGKEKVKVGMTESNNCLLYTSTSVVDFLIDVVFIPDLLRHREFGKTILYADLGFHIAYVIFFEGFPLCLLYTSRCV